MTIVVLAYYTRSNLDPGCGIDVCFWIMIFFAILLVRSFCELVIYF